MDTGDNDLFVIPQGAAHIGALHNVVQHFNLAPHENAGFAFSALHNVCGLQPAHTFGERR